MTDSFQSPSSRPPTKTFSDAASDVARNVAGMARDTGAQANQVVRETASSAKDHVKDILDRQLEASVEAAGQLAKSMRVASNDLEQHSPLMAGLVGAVASKIDGYAEDMQDRTVDHLMYVTTDLTRRQPALVFGIAALAGFFVYRAIKSTPPLETQAPSIQPSAGDE
jgi:hypothetical protein